MEEPLDTSSQSSPTENVQIVIKAEPLDSPPLLKECRVRLSRAGAKDIVLITNGFDPKTYTERRRLKWSCAFCPYISSAMCTTTRHVNRSHTRERNFECKLCNMKFMFNYDYLGHVRRHSVDRKMFQCSFCSRCLKSKLGLKIHEARHTGRKDFPCTFCDKAFSSHYGLTVHTRHHTGERPYPCKFCAFESHSHSGLQAHMRLHTVEQPYACSFCPRRFSLNTNRVAHERRLHTGERPFPCSVCPKAFASKSDLNAHQWIHRPGHEAPYCCEHCQKGFGRKDSMESHAMNCRLKLHCQVCNETFSSQLNLNFHECRAESN